jgi:ribose-phosphate pyrophosphokinase
MTNRPLALFALNTSRSFGEAVASHLGTRLEPHEEREFEDGEHKARPLVSVHGRDVYVIQSLYSDDSQSVNDKLCRLLFFLATLRDHSAARVTAVIPYLAYARKDLRTQPHDPLTTRYVAELLEATGIDRVITIDVHNTAAFQNAFRCLAGHLEAREVFAQHLAPRFERDAHIVTVSPDVGGVKRAERFRLSLERWVEHAVDTAFFEKSRGAGKLSFGELRGEVSGADVLILDDLISTGSTMAHAAQECKAKGARSVVAIATHGLFVGAANRVLRDASIDRILVADTVPPSRLAPELLREKLEVVSVSGLFAEEIKRISEASV